MFSEHQRTQSFVQQLVLMSNLIIISNMLLINNNKICIGCHIDDEYII